MEAKEAGKVTGGTMENMAAVRLAKDLIIDQFGTLDDLPKDLAITIANVYYKFTINILKNLGFENKYMLSESEKRQVRQFGRVLGEIVIKDKEPQILAELKSLLDSVKSSRKQDKETSVTLTDSNVELILKNLKSNGNVQGKTGIQQAR